MITGEKDKLDEIAKSYVCRDEGGHLSVAWHGISKSDGNIVKDLGRGVTPQEVNDGGFYTLRCEHDHFPEEVTRQPTLTEQYKQGAELPEPIQSNVKKGIEKRAARLPQHPQAVTTFGVSAVDLDTGELIPYEKLAALVLYARSYGLDPARGHVALMHGEPYITIDGYLYHANQKNIPFSLTGRPLKIDELEAQGYGVGDRGWYSKVERHDTHQVFEGYGFITNREITEMSKRHPDRLRYPVVSEKPGNMVIKRADWQVLRRAFPIGGDKKEVDK